MMLFIFARHVFMHFHALLVPIPSFLYLNASTVFLFISLSLSFSLLVMAPKKSIPSKNPIRRGSSSFSFPPNSIWFHDEKAQANFSKNFSDLAIHSKCQVILSDFLDTPLPNAISFRGWASLCEKPLRCPDVFIKEFYSNMHVIDTFVP